MLRLPPARQYQESAEDQRQEVVITQSNGFVDTPEGAIMICRILQVPREEASVPARFFITNLQVPTPRIPGL